MPAALPRLPTPAEEAEVRRLADGVLGELRSTQVRLGHAPALSELEAAGPDGHPHLPSGLPDNPLAPGVAGVAPGCSGDGSPPVGIDWLYCPAPLEFRPAHESMTQSRNP